MRFCHLIAVAKSGATMTSSTGPNPLVLMAPRTRTAAEFDARAPLQSRGVELTRLQEPTLAGVEMMERAPGAPTGLANNRSDRRRELPARSYAQRPDGIGELAQERRVLVDVANHDGEALAALHF